jgi:aryl-alcohol dehydrogenase-like predicted oxidoreductase
MEYTHIPNLSHKISRIGLGTWSIGGWMWGGTDEAESIETIHEALERGITLIDTAPAYGFGKSEEIVGKALKRYGKRNQYVVATKAGLSWENGKVFRDARKRTILKEVDDSLRRLQLDYIDLYQVHWPDPLVPIHETADAMQELLIDGKIHSVGVSNFSLEQMDEFKRHCPLHAVQPPFNMFERDAEKDIIPFCFKKKLAILGYGVLCRGLLTGKMQKNRQFQGDDLRKIDPKFQDPRYSQYLKCIELLQDWVKQKYQRPILALAVRWVLDKGINIPLWGARKPEQLSPLDSIWGWKLTEDDFKEIDLIIEKTVRDPVGPQFMAPPSRKEKATSL